MSQFITFVVLGLPSGAIYLGISVGLVTVYLSSGILNFAHAAMGMFGGFLFWQLRGGAIAGSGLGTPWAFVVTIVAVAGVGVLIHLLVMRPLLARMLLVSWRSRTARPRRA